MAKITKKTALFSIAIIVGLLTLVKFAWKPLQSDTKVSAPVSEKQAAPILAAPSGNTASAARTASVKRRYNNPGGSDEVGFVLSVDDKGIITSVKTEVLAVNKISQMRQEAFASAMPQVLIGKDINTLGNLDRVGGSSLTTNAFNTSIEELKAQL